MPKFSTFIFGIISGIIAAFLAAFIEGLFDLSNGNINNLAAGSSGFALFLILPALIEESLKVLPSQKLLRYNNKIIGIVGLGIGFGSVEYLLTKETVGIHCLVYLLPILHTFFLGLGYFIAHKTTLKLQDNYQKTLIWIISSSSIHWLYNTAIFFLTKHKIDS